MKKTVIHFHSEVQLEPTTSWALLQKDLSRPSKYSGMHQAAKDIFRDEGLLVELLDSNIV